VELLRKPFGIYLLASGIMMLWPKKKKPDSASSDEDSKPDE